MALKGSCLCKGITYEIEQLDLPIAHCHCTTCRKAHASAYTTTAGVLRSNFRILSGETLISGYESSAGKTRHFCNVCGCQMFAERLGQPHLILRLATLDDDPGQRPEYHIWTEHDVSWLEPDCPVYPQWQPGR